MKTYKITTTTGYEAYFGCSLTNEQFIEKYLNFDYDEFNKFIYQSKPSWDKSSGIIKYIELFYCDERNEQVKEVLINNLDK